MYGLILKDLYQNFVIRKNLFTHIASTAALLILIAINENFMKNELIFKFLMLALMPVTGTNILSTSLFHDEKSKFDEILLTLPIKKEIIILSKLIGPYIYTIVLYLTIVPLLCFMYIHSGTIDMNTAIQTWLFSLILSFVFLPICNTLYFAFGSLRGAVVFMVGFFVFVLLVLRNILRFGNNSMIINAMERILSQPLYMFIIEGVLLAAIFNIVGYILNLKIYSLKHR